MKPNFFTMMNDPVDPLLDKMLNKCLDKGINELSTTEYNLHIVFNNNVEANLWNTNRWYGWLSRGNIGPYVFDDGRPKKKTMRRVRRAIEEYHLSKIL